MKYPIFKKCHLCFCDIYPGNTGAICHKCYLAAPTALPSLGVEQSTMEEFRQAQVEFQLNFGNQVRM